MNNTESQNAGSILEREKEVSAVGDRRGRKRRERRSVRKDLDQRNSNQEERKKEDKVRKGGGHGQKPGRMEILTDGTEC